MTLDLASPAELWITFNWAKENPELHMDDNGPKTVEEFLTYLKNENITVLAARKGHKFIGSIGIKPGEDEGWIKGIHFIPEVRGTGAAYTAVMAAIATFHPFPVYLKYFADNPFMPGLVRRMGGRNIDGGGSTTRNGVPVDFQLVEFRGAPLVTLT
jgi:RimJ/RimL family protein N-acetyltransferase